jgi:hypothetical protein
MPPGDFPGYVAVVRQVRDALLVHGAVPAWCADCFGGSSYFVSSFKEYLAFPLAIGFDAVFATRLLLVLAKLGAAWGMYAVADQLSFPRSVGVVAGYAYCFGATSNYTFELDTAISLLLFPVVFLTASGMLRRGTPAPAVGLGISAACALVNNWVHAASLPLMVVLLTLAPSSRPRSAGPGPTKLRRLGLASLALVVLSALAASHVAWTLGDARHHGLVSLEEAAQDRERYSERSALRLIDRGGVLQGRIAALERGEAPEPRVESGERYLGAVVIAVCACAWLWRRRPPSLRRCRSIAAIPLLFSYWLALGPHTLLGQNAGLLGLSRAAESQLAQWLQLLSAGLALAGLAYAARGRPSRSVQLWGVALLALFPTLSLWNGIAEIAPPLRQQRSPGHFFDVAPFYVSLLFAVGAATLVSGARTKARAHVAMLAIGALVAIDFWPSTRAFERGAPLQPLRETADLVASLPGNGASLRIALAPMHSPTESWLAGHARAGHAWGWLGWQAGPHWRDFLQAAVWRFRGERGETQSHERDVQDPLLAVGRIRFFLLDERLPDLPPPWQRLRGDASGRFALWEQPDASPMAVRYHASVLMLEGCDEILTARHAARHGILALSSRGSADAGARERVDLVVAPGEHRGGSGPGATSFVREDEAWWTRLRERAHTGPLDYSRPAPDRIRIGLDAATTRTTAFVSEGHHPWWTAVVDGRPAEVFRAQLAFMAVPVPAGARRLELRFEPPRWIRAAELCTRLAWGGVGLWGIAWLGTRGRGAWRSSRSPA